MVPRSRLDIGWLDLLFALGQCARPGRAAPVRSSIEEDWAGNGRGAVACLSVRSGFDLLLGALALPPASEVIFSAVTIRDMPRIAESHGLVPVPVEVDMRRLAVDLAALEHAISRRTRLLVVAHLYGSRMPMDRITAIARRHGVLVVEDCAQAFAGDGYRGASTTDVSMFSFGPIKTNTALGGAILCVRDARLADRMRAAQERNPVQLRTAFLRRVLLYLAIKTLLLRPAFTAFTTACRLAGADHDAVINRAVRGFPGSDLVAQIRRQPGRPLLVLLRRRLSGFRADRIAVRVRTAETVMALLPHVPRPGDLAERHTHWVFPVLHPDPDVAAAALRRLGLDATRGAASLHVLPATPGRRPASAGHVPCPLNDSDRTLGVASEPLSAARALDGVLYLPVYRGIPASALRRLARAAVELWPSTSAASNPEPLE